MITATSTSLLIGLRDANDQVWGEFYARYQPVLVGFGRRLGLRQEDAEDAAQETLLAFSAAYRKGEYDRDKGRLRTWLLGIAKNKIHDLHRRHGRDVVIVAKDGQSGVMDKVADDESISQVWEAEWREAILAACIERLRGEVKASTLQAFELLVLQEWPSDRVATHLGMSVDAVMKAKRRTLSRIREMYRDMQTNW